MGPEREGPLRSPRGERDKCGPAKHVRFEKVHKRGKKKGKDMSTRMSSKCG